MKEDLFTKEEQEMLRNFNAGKLKRVKHMDKEKKRYQGYAKYTLQKSKSINIRLPE